MKKTRSIARTRTKRRSSSLVNDAAFEREVAAVLDRFAARARAQNGAASASPPTTTTSRSRPISLAAATRAFQRKLVLEALESHQLAGRWNIVATARALGTTRARIYDLIVRLKLPRRRVSDVRPRTEQ